jgi:hypothetical protein
VTRPWDGSARPPVPRTPGDDAERTGPLAAIGDQFPGWHAYRSRPEPGRLARFWATRTGRKRRRPEYLHPDDSARWAMTVDGDNPAQLRQAIEEQQEIDDTS